MADEGAFGVWMKPLSDGSKAVSRFNRKLGAVPITLPFPHIAVGQTAFLHELRAYEDLAVFKEESSRVVALKAK
jgi:hypothetical protein